MRIWIKYPLMFAVMVLLQVLLLNQIHLGGFLNPYIYILFIFLLPISMPRYQVLLLSFLIGITIDWFSNTLGLHAASALLIGFLRSPVMKLITIREIEQSDYPGMKQTGIKWFITYVSVLVVMHHMFLFYLEVFSFDNFFRTLLRTLLSSVFTIIIIVLSQYLAFRK
jgi:rod shape-determining protein MreD